MDFDWREPLNVSLQWCEDVKNTDVLGEFEAGYTGPVLAIAGKEDTTVDPEWSNKIVAASKNPASRPASSREWITPSMCLPRRISTLCIKAVDETGKFFSETLR